MILPLSLILFLPVMLYCHSPCIVPQFVYHKPDFTPKQHHFGYMIQNQALVSPISVPAKQEVSIRVQPASHPSCLCHRLSELSDKWELAENLHLSHPDNDSLNVQTWFQGCQ